MTTGTLIFFAGIAVTIAAVIATVVVTIQLRKSKQKLDEHMKEWY